MGRKCESSTPANPIFDTSTVQQPPETFGMQSSSNDDNRLQPPCRKPDAIIICVPTPLTAKKRSGPPVHRENRRSDSEDPAQRTDHLPGKHHLSRHHRRDPARSFQKPQAWKWARTTFWCSLPNEKIPATRSSQPARSQRLSGEQPRTVWRSDGPCTARLSIASYPSHRHARRNW